MFRRKGLSAWQRIRDLVAENHRLTGEVKRLVETIRRMERAFEEVQQASEQYQIGLASSSWKEHRDVEQQVLEVMKAVIPTRADLEHRAAEAAEHTRRHHIRSFLKRLIHHTRVNRPELP